MAKSAFGNLLRAFRLRSNYGLREFAQLISESPSNLSAVEKGRRAPWRTLDKLRAIAEALSLQEGSRDWDQFFLSARIRNSLPNDLEALLGRDLNLALLRTVEEKKLTDQQLRELIAYVNKERWANGQSDGN